MTIEALWAVIIGPLAAWNLKLQTQVTKNESEIAYVKSSQEEIKDSVQKLHDKMDQLTDYLIRENLKHENSV